MRITASTISYFWDKSEVDLGKSEPLEILYCNEIFTTQKWIPKFSFGGAASEVQANDIFRCSRVFNLWGLVTRIVQYMCCKVQAF